jgi:hypothetical protein
MPQRTPRARARQVLRPTRPPIVTTTAAALVADPDARFVLQDAMRCWTEGMSACNLDQASLWLSGLLLLVEGVRALECQTAGVA